MSRRWFTKALPSCAHVLRTGSCIVLLSLLLGVHSPGQTSDTLGTKLTLVGKELEFRWDAKHPWAGQMSSAGVELFAEYSTERQGKVIEKLASRRPATAGANLVTFDLPDTLQAVPRDTVCLYLQVAGGRRIPLRKPRSGDSDTEHFDVPGWRDTVKGNAVSHLHEARLQALESAVANGTAALAAEEAQLRDKRWTEAASCEAVQPPAFVAKARPADVLPAEKHDDAARHVCVRRAVYLLQALEQQAKPDAPGNLILALPDPALDGTLLRYLHTQKGVDSRDLALREGEFLHYRTDWDRWYPIVKDEIQRNVTPVLGSGDDELKLQDVTAEVGYEILSFRNPSAPVLDRTRNPKVQDVLGYVGGSLETYTRCVHDGQDELAAKLRAWNEQVERAPMLERMSRDQLRAQCVDALAARDQHRQQLATLQKELDAERQRVGGLARPLSTPVAAQTGTPLNGAACTVR